MSSVVTADGYAVTMWNNASDQVIAALDSDTGKTRWTTKLSSSYKNSMGDGPRATPAIMDGVIYAYTGEGILAAVKLETGEIIWRVNTVSDNQTIASEYGMSSSPLVWKNVVIVHTGGRGSAICAYDLKTGTQVWRAGSGAAGYSSPTLQTIDGQVQIVSFIAAGIVGVDPANGKVLWTYPFKTAYDCNTASPILIDGMIFCSAGENHGCVLLEITRQGTDYVVNEQWQSVDTKSVMRNEWQTSIAVDGYLYGFDNVGSAGPVTHFSCVNATTGDPVWQEVRFGKGNLTLADGKFWITTMQGELVLVNVNSQRYQEMGRVQLFGKTRQSLTIANGFGYIRDDQEIVCIDLRKPNQ